MTLPNAPPFQSGFKAFFNPENLSSIAAHGFVSPEICMRHLPIFKMRPLVSSRFIPSIIRFARRDSGGRSVFNFSVTACHFSRFDDRYLSSSAETYVFRQTFALNEICFVERCHLAAPFSPRPDSPVIFPYSNQL